MRRTQIYLNDDHYRLLLDRARREGKTISALIREILDDSLGLASKASKDSFDEVIGLVKGDGSRVAENHEDWLYGKKS